MKMSAVFPSKYVRAADLNGKTVTLTIQKCVMEEMMNHSKEKERKPVLYFRNATKGLVLNRTNGMIIANLYGDETDEWVGRKISIYPTKVKAFGELQDAIRVKEEVPAQPKPVAQATMVTEASEIDDAEDTLDQADDVQVYTDEIFDPEGGTPNVHG